MRDLFTDSWLDPEASTQSDSPAMCAIGEWMKANGTADELQAIRRAVAMFGNCEQPSADELKPCYALTRRIPAEMVAQARLERAMLQAAIVVSDQAIVTRDARTRAQLRMCPRTLRID